MEQSALVQIPGYQSVLNHFGGWPSFHDAQILQLKLDHSGASLLSIHAWNTTRELDNQGYYRLTDHAAVHFTLKGISNVELWEFNVGSIIFGLEIRVEAGEFEVALDPCVGLYGKLRCQSISISVEPDFESSNGRDDRAERPLT